jgi:hypothetical protein
MSSTLRSQTWQVNNEQSAVNSEQRTENSKKQLILVLSLGEEWRIVKNQLLEPRMDSDKDLDFSTRRKTFLRIPRFRFFFQGADTLFQFRHLKRLADSFG